MSNSVSNSTPTPVILIVEDKEHHIIDAIQAVEAAGYQAMVVKDFVTAITKIPTAANVGQRQYSKEYAPEGLVGVLSDIHFPTKSGQPGQHGDADTPCGMGILLACLAVGLPCVLVTDQYHHAGRMEWIHQAVWATAETPIDTSGKLVDGRGLWGEGHTDHKDWASALSKLKL